MDALGTDAVGGLIDVKRDARDAVEGAPVVLGLEAEVALDEDGDAGGLAADVLADVADVGGDERELFGGIYRKKRGQTKKRAGEAGLHLCSP